mgnify:CR=1 FL=1
MRNRASFAVTLLACAAAAATLVHCDDDGDGDGDGGASCNAYCSKAEECMGETFEWLFGDLSGCLDLCRHAVGEELPGCEMACDTSVSCDDWLSCLDACEEEQIDNACPGYEPGSGDDYCCQVDDPCGWADDGFCDCGGACFWDGADCAD